MCKHLELRVMLTSHIILLIQMGAFIVANKSSSTVNVFVSKFNRKSGDDSWFPVAAGSKESWGAEGGKNVWEVVAFQDPSHKETVRSGRYVQVDSTIVFHSFDNIDVN